MPHCGATAAIAWSTCYAKFRTSSPQSSDLVFFAADPSNGGNGHVGSVNGDGTFHSILSDGAICDLSISGFGVPALGYVSTAAVLGKPAPTPAPSAPNNAVTQALQTVSQGGSDWGRYIAWGLAALLGLYALDEGAGALADLA